MNISTIAIIVAVAAIFLFDYFIKNRKGVSKISLIEDKSKFKKFENKVIRSSIIILLLLFLLTQFNHVITNFTTSFFSNTVVNNIELKDPMYTVDNDKAEELFNNLALSNNFTYDEFSNTLDDKKISLEILFDSIKKSDINNERFFFIEEFLNYFDSNANLEVPQIDYELVRRYSPEDMKVSIVKLSKQILVNPNDDELFFNRGRYKAALNNDFGAIDDFNEAIKLNPSEAEYYLRRGSMKYFYFKDYLSPLITIEVQYLDYKENYYNEWEYYSSSASKRYIDMPGFIKAEYNSRYNSSSIYGDQLLTSYDCINPDKKYYNYFLSNQRSRKALPERKGNRSYRYTPGTKTYYQLVVKAVNSLKSDAVTKSKYFYSAQKDLIKAFELEPENFDITSSLANLYFYKRDYSKSIKTLNKYLELTKDISNHATIYVSIANAYGASDNLIKACEFYSKSADLGNLEVYNSEAFKNCK